MKISHKYNFDFFRLILTIIFLHIRVVKICQKLTFYHFSSFLWGSICATKCLLSLEFFTHYKMPNLLEVTLLGLSTLSVPQFFVANKMSALRMNVQWRKWRIIHQLKLVVGHISQSTHEQISRIMDDIALSWMKIGINFDNPS